MEPVEERAAGAGPLEPREHLGHPLEVRAVPGHSPVGVPHMTLQPPGGDHALDGQRGERQDRRRPAGRPRRAKAKSATAVEGGGAEAKTHCRGTRRRRQGGERVAVHGRRDLLAEDGQVFSEIEVGRQRLYGLLPRAHRRGIRRREQPGGQRVLAHARPRGA